MMGKVPKYLDSTYTMLKSAFENGVTEADYEMVIKLLYEEMSDRNIAKVLSLITKKDEGHILNDVYRVSRLEVKSELVERVKSILMNYGYEDWLKEE